MKDAPVLVAASRVGATACGIITSPILARTLGPEGRGATAAAVAVVSVLPLLAGLGLPVAIRRAAARKVLTSQLEKIARKHELRVTPIALLAAPCVALAVFNGRPLAELVALGACVALLPLSMRWIFDANVLLGRGRFAAFSLLNILPTFVYLLMIATVSALGFLTVVTTILASLSGLLVTSLVSQKLIRTVPAEGVTVHTGINREGRSFYGAQLAEVLSYKLDQVIVLPLAGAQVAGMYAIAATLSMLPFAIAQAVGAIAFNAVATGRNADDALEMRARAIRCTGSVGLASALAIGVVTPFAVPAVFGADFAPAIGPSLVAIAGSVMLCVGYVANLVLAASGRGRAAGICQGVGLASGLLLLVMLAPAYGATGAAAASSVGYFVSAALALRALRIPMGQLVPKSSDLRFLVTGLASGW